MVTPQRTALNLFGCPHNDSPVMVCVVLTGLAQLFGHERVVGTAVSAATPSSGVVFFGDFAPGLLY